MAGCSKKAEDVNLNISDECLKKLEGCMEDYLSSLPITKEKKEKIKGKVLQDAKKRFSYLHCYSINTGESSCFFKTLLKERVKKADIAPIFLIIRTNEQIAVSTKYGVYPKDLVS